MLKRSPPSQEIIIFIFILRPMSLYFDVGQNFAKKKVSVSSWIQSQYVNNVRKSRVNESLLLQGMVLHYHLNCDNVACYLLTDVDKMPGNVTFGTHQLVLPLSVRISLSSLHWNWWWSMCPDREFWVGCDACQKKFLTSWERSCMHGFVPIQSQLPTDSEDVIGILNSWSLEIKGAFFPKWW